MRPGCAIGHMGPVNVSSVPSAVSFYAMFGMRTVMSTDSMAILELRGGTHLILRRGPTQAGRVPFDLMVDDLDGVRSELAQSGAELGPIRHGGVHRTFDVLGPDGHHVAVTSSHAVGPV